jgi:hypothetical protein
MPRPPVTQHANRRCYARSLNDCDQKLSKEHYLSRGVVRILAQGGPTNTVRATGLGLPPGELPPDQVAQSKILCRRHNSALSHLDVVGERLFRAIREGLKLIPAYRYHSAPGVDVERWLLKVACGVRAVSANDVPDEWLRMLFGYSELPSPRGMYMYLRLGETIRETRGLQFGLYRRGGAPSGAEIVFDGVRFTLDLVGERRTHRDSDIGSLMVYRPSGIWFDHADSATFHIGFEWGARVAATESVVVHPS